MLEIAHSRVFVPTDPFIAYRNPPGRAGKLHTGDNAPLWQFGINQVTQVGSKRHGMPEVVIPTHQFAKQPTRLIASHQFQLQPPHIVRRSLNHSASITALRYGHCRPASQRTPRSLVGQHQKTSGLQLLQKFPALPRLQRSAPPPPAQQFTDRPGQFHSRQASTAGNHFLDHLQIFSSHSMA